ncbi:MAG: M28 family peptidase [Acidobacteriota bacterium]
MRFFRAAATLCCLALLSPACSRPAPPAFSTDRAAAHVRMLAGSIGSRPIGSEANARARQYVVDQLRALGFDVRVQVADARRPEIGLTAHVQNIIAIKPGPHEDALALVSHYDSSPFAPGGADDALGVAVAIEAARVLLQKPLQHTLAVVVTDGEEVGLMGAAALDADPIGRQLGAYINLEAVGSAGPSLLFEAGPGNGWIVDAWARHAPEPRGGSFAIEIYRRIPNDTDFSILKRLDVPGLNFAPVLDGYAYHTARDTAERLSIDTITQTGLNVVATARALDEMDLSRRTVDQPTFFDLLGRSAVSIGPLTAAWISGFALVLGLVTWVKVLQAGARAVGVGRLLWTMVWSLVGAAAVLGMMVAAAWLLREAREVYHPWYARPERLFLVTAMMGVLGGWGAARLGALLPPALRGCRHPVLAWSLALPAWMALGAAASYFAPAAAYLFILPLLVGSLLLLVTPLANTAAVRLASLVAFGANAVLWAWLLLQLLRFAVAHFGRQPLITPVWVYAAFMFVGGIVLAPPALAVTTGRPLRQPQLTTALLLALVVVCAGFAYSAPAYTRERPLRRAVLYAQDSTGGGAYWQVGSNEPGLDLLVQAARWSPLRAPLPLAVAVPRLPYPFVFHAHVNDTWPVPGAVSIRTSPVGEAIEFTVSVRPAEPGLAATFVMPKGLTPIRPNLPGIVSRTGSWTTSFAGLPPEGVAFHATVPSAQANKLPDIRVILRTPRLPGGTGWQGLPDWLLQDRTVWTSEARYIVAPLPEVAPPQ